jgi:hypothetical protein
LDVQPTHDNYVYVRVKNIGPVPTSTFYIRVYLSHWSGPEFVYPSDFIPTNHPGNPLPSPLVPGTYLLGEVQHGPLSPNGVDVVNVTWAQAAIPPQTVPVSGTTVHWHPCLLVEISPQDGPTPTGVHVWDNNNLAQKNVTIAYADDDATFGAALVVGNLLNPSGSLELDIDRSKLPVGIRLYVDVLDPRARRELTRLMEEASGPEECPPPEIVLIDETRVLVERFGGEGCDERAVITLPQHARLKLCDLPERPGRGSRISVGYVRGREVFWLPSDEMVRIPLMAGPGALIPLIVGGAVTEAVIEGAYLVGITQRNLDGATSGAVAVEVRLGKG